MAFNYTVVKTKFGAEWAQPAVNDLPVRKQVVRSPDIDYSTLAFVSGDTVPVLPVGAGFIVNKVYTIIMTACTSGTTLSIGYAYMTETSGVPGTTLTSGSTSAFGQFSADATAQSGSVPGKTKGGTLEATDTGVAAGIYFPVDGFITATMTGAEPIVGKIRFVAELIDAGRIN